MHSSAERFPGGETWSFLSKAAARHGVTLHAGSIVEKDGEGFYNTSLVFGPEGEQIARTARFNFLMSKRLKALSTASMTPFVAVRMS